ncbi:MAG: hypothetical protein WDN69_02515 [Aliidongia sp.]
MTAGRGGGDARDEGQLAGSQCPAVHQRIQHIGAGRIADQGSDLGHARS